MCRFTFYKGKPLLLSALLTEPEHSLIHQSFHARERDEPLNGDGFGVAWYAEGHDEPALFRSVTPAWSNQNLRELSRVTASHCVLAHVRAATQGLQVGEPNCHPFRRDRIAFMHNGDIGGFAAIRRPLLEVLSDGSFNAIRGTTDSEHFFALLYDELAAGAAGPPGSRCMADALRRRSLPLTTLESRTPLREMDVVGCSVQRMHVSVEFLYLGNHCRVQPFLKFREDDRRAVFGSPNEMVIQFMK